MEKLKTVFFGTPDIAVPYLELLHQMTDVQLAVTQADKPRGRGMVITPCPVKKRALELGLPVLSPEILKNHYEDLAKIPFDLGVVVAYGKIFRPNFLALPKYGLINVHFSLLPHLRGAAPVQQALIQGYTQTGVSTFWIQEGMDDGPIYLQKSCPIDPQDNAQTLFEKLIPLGVEALKETLQGVQAGKLIRTPQTGTPTTAPMISKEEALLSFTQLNAVDFHNKARGLACGPKPKVLITLKGKQEPLQIIQTALPNTAEKAAPGTVLCVEKQKGILVQCKEGSVWLTTVLPAGKKAMPAYDYAMGHALKAADKVFN
ncbi:methionyl-tRNA formyltransferase [Candidatus Avelusimicrobium aviculae]|uniref:methionyl-tRNA formyltransferase n=1 Tax=Candidatus Avelusimicrobium aviculae TaxID=3416206 RepID=UPI003D0A065B